MYRIPGSARAEQRDILLSSLRQQPQDSIAYLSQNQDFRSLNQRGGDVYLSRRLDNLRGSGPMRGNSERPGRNFGAQRSGLSFLRNGLRDSISQGVRSQPSLRERLRSMDNYGATYDVPGSSVLRRGGGQVLVDSNQGQGFFDDRSRMRSLGRSSGYDLNRINQGAFESQRAGMPASPLSDTTQMLRGQNDYVMSNNPILGIQTQLQQGQPQLQQQPQQQLIATNYNQGPAPMATQTVVQNQQYVQQPATIVSNIGQVGVASSVNTAALPATNTQFQATTGNVVTSGLAQPATSYITTSQQATANNLVPVKTVIQPAPVLQPAPFLLQQQPQVLSLISLAPQPVQTVYSQFPQSAATGFSGISGMGPGLARAGMAGAGIAGALGGRGGMFSNAGPVILKIEDMLPGGGTYQNPIGPGAGVSEAMGNSGTDPGLAVVKLDEGLQVVVNNSAPSNKILNLPAPRNEEEANMLKKMLENAEAPEYLHESIKVGAGSMGGAAMMSNAAMMPNAAAMANAAAMPNSMQVPMMGTVPTGGASLTSAAAAPAMPGIQGDLAIDEVIANAFTGHHAQGGSNYPLASSQPNSQFVLTALDMELTQQQFAELYASPGVSTGRKKRKAVVNTKARWPGGIIPYQITNGHFTAADISMLQAAMATWSQSTCLQFRPAVPGDANMIVFQGGTGCSSNVGMIGGQQKITLQKECRIMKILLHEIGHTIGLIHEHQRGDRDSYLKINYHNIKPGGLKDFHQFKVGSVDNSLAGYDYMSIMHYGKNAFAREPKMVTMQAVDPKYTAIMGTAKTLSYSDITTVNTMYGCGMAYHSPVTSGTAEGTVANSIQTAMTAAAAVTPVQTNAVDSSVVGSTVLNSPAVTMG